MRKKEQLNFSHSFSEGKKVLKSEKNFNIWQ